METNAFESNLLLRILEVSRRMAEIRTVDPLLGYVTDEAIKLVGAERGYIVLLHPDGSLDFRVTRDQRGDPVAHAADQISTSVLNQVVRTGQALILRDAITDPQFSDVRSIVTLHLRSIMCVPLISFNRLVGAIYVENRSVTGRFKQQDLPPLTLFANQAAVAIENAVQNNALEHEQAALRESEAQLCRHRDHLEELVVERTAQLSEANQHLQQEVAQRVQAQQVLEQRNQELDCLNRELEIRNQELDAFAHTVAHDLKNPIHVILSLAHLLERDYDRVTQQQACDWLRRIYELGFKLDAILESMLTLAGVRKADVTPAALDMGSIVAEALRRLLRMIEERHAEVVLPAPAAEGQPPAWPVARGYAPWVEEVWVNYISNALKYGGSPPRVELGATVQPGGHVRCWVRDNGCGLTPEQRDRLFTPFTQLRQVDIKGYGLGLSIVQRIMDRLGGEVGVESEPGCGSLFYFTLPGQEGGVGSRE